MGGMDWRGGEGKYGGNYSSSNINHDLDESGDVSPLRGRGAASFGDDDDYDHRGWSSASASATGGYGRK